MAVQAYTTDIVIRGSKADKYQELKLKYGFDLIDVYMMAGVIGFLNNKKDISKNDTETTANLPRNVLNNRADKIDVLSQIIWLSKEIEVDPDEAIKIAFEEKKEDGEKLDRRELFFDYSMGGIDILYDMLSNTDFDNQVNNLKNIIDKYSDQYDANEQTIDELLDREGF